MKDVNLIAPINQLGYGVAGFNVLKELSKISKVAFWPIGNPDCSPEDSEVVRQGIINAQQPEFHSPCIKLWHQHDMGQFVGKGSHIGFPVFELDTFTDIEKCHLNHLDAIFVCSDWAKNVVTKNKISTNVYVVPLGVNREIFRPSNFTSENTVFLNCGKWEIRKGHDILIEAFNKAFNGEDKVELWMMCENPFFSEEENKEWSDFYKDSPLGSKVKIIPRQETQKEVYNIMAHADCGVFPSRAEGWNLELLEMMSCGKHVIATDYSGHTEFCNAENSLLIPVKDKEEAFDGKWFHGQGQWAKLDDQSMKNLVCHMKTIHRTKQNGTIAPNTNGVETAKKFSWKNTAKEMLNALSKS